MHFLFATVTNFRHNDDCRALKILSLKSAWKSSLVFIFQGRRCWTLINYAVDYQQHLQWFMNFCRRLMNFSSHQSNFNFDFFDRNKNKLNKLFIAFNAVLPQTVYIRRVHQSLRIRRASKHEGRKINNLTLMNKDWNLRSFY